MIEVTSGDILMDDPETIVSTVTVRAARKAME
jgi:hypothetical protein